MLTDHQHIVAPGIDFRQDLGMMIHPMHLHGTHMTVIAKDGWDQTVHKKCDTLNIAPGERWDVLVKASNPGTWAFHCHILPEHGIGARNVRDGHRARREAGDGLRA